MKITVKFYRFCPAEGESTQNEDTDMRLPINGFESCKPDFQAILARANEQFKNGTMSPADYSKVSKQVCNFIILLNLNHSFY